MYAVIETGGKQYRVEFGTEIEVEHLDVDAGQSIDLDRILLVADGDQATIGSPLVNGALVRADVVRQDRGEKLIVFKYKPKARRRVKKGHRQELTVLRISEISLDGRSAADDAAKVQADERQTRRQREEEASRQAATDQALAAKLAAAAAKAQAETAEAPAKKTRSRGAKSASTTAPAAAPAAPAAAPAAPAAEPATIETAPAAMSEPVAGGEAVRTEDEGLAAVDVAAAHGAIAVDDAVSAESEVPGDETDETQTTDASRKDQ